MLIVSGILLFFSLNQPKISLDEYNSSNSASLADTNNSKTNNSSTYNQNSNSQYSNSQSSDTQVRFPININTCTVEELLSVDGIGNSRASAIIEYREYLGGYTSVEQIKNISGIGDSVYQSISPYLCV